MSVYRYVCMFCVNACIYVDLNICSHGCPFVVSVCVYACARECLYVRMHTFMYLSQYASLYVCTDACMFARVNSEALVV